MIEFARQEPVLFRMEWNPHADPPRWEVIGQPGCCDCQCECCEVDMGDVTVIIGDTIYFPGRDESGGDVTIRPID